MKKRGGFTLLELLFSMLILSGCFVIISQYNLYGAKQAAKAAKDYEKIVTIDGIYKQFFNDVKSASLIRIPDSQAMILQKSTASGDSITVYEILDNSLYRNGDYIIGEVYGSFSQTVQNRADVNLSLAGGQKILLQLHKGGISDE